MKKTGALLLGLGLLAATPAIAQDAAAGRQVAEKVCSECHFVDSVDFKTSKAPGLLAVARMSSVTELSLKVFLQTPHAAMPAVALTQRELDDVVTFILGLKGNI